MSEVARSIATTQTPELALKRERGIRERKWFYRFYLAALMGANAVLLLPATNYGQTGSNAFYLASWIALDAVLFVFLLLVVNQRPKQLVLLLTFGAYVLCSAAWSVAPASTALYGTMLVCNLLVAHMMSLDLSLVEIIKIVREVILVLCIAGLILYFLKVPQVFYYDSHSRPNLIGGQPLRGLFVHKILAGFYAALGSVLYLTTATRARRVTAIGVFAGTIILTSSATGIVLFALGLAVVIGARYFVTKNVRPVPFFLSLLSLLAVGGVAAAALWTPILELLGRDATLTGRTVLWKAGLDAFSERPVFGWGFAGYFNSSFGEQLSQRFPQFRNYEVPHFHEAYIQSAVDLGVIGLAVAVGLLLIVAVRSYSLALRSPRHSSQQNAAVATFACVAMIMGGGSAVFLFITYNHFATFAIFLFALVLIRADDPRLPSAEMGLTTATEGDH